MHVICAEPGMEERKMKTGKVRFTAAAAAFMIAAGSLAVPAFAVQTQDVSAKAGDYTSSARAMRETRSQTMNNVYLLPDSDTYYITEADVSWMDDNDLMLARNEFYARRGRKFATKSIQDYFNRQAWYSGTIEPDDFTSEMFNRYEQANVDFIVAYEKKRKEYRVQKEEKKKKKETQAVVVQRSNDYTDEYSELVDIYGDALRMGWSKEDLDYAGMNDLVADLYNPEELGYTYRDLDGDGIPELLIGPTDPQLYGEGAVFEIFTIEDGIPVEVACSDGDVFYYVCEDDTVRKEFVEEEGWWEIDYCNLDNGELVCKEVLVMDEEENAEDPWFVIKEQKVTAVICQSDEETAEHYKEKYEAVSYEYASELRAAHSAASLGLTAYGN